MQPSHWAPYLPSWSPQDFCKPLAGEAGWPSTAAWNALNQSVSGRLVAPVPLGAVCHHDWPEYSAASCGVVTANWTNTTFQALNPVSVDYNDETCLYNTTEPCSRDGYPQYVVVAETVEDVQAGVNFARESGVRLVIKGTGHDYPGRSSGPDSLSIYIHNIQGLSVNRTDPRATALGAPASIKIYAGQRLGEVYSFAAANNVTAIGGSDPHVGIGGWVSGGGHGPLTAKYGMGADQVIEMEVVTADGQYRVINAENDSDLFWAMRGGGAGTFAVLISVTMKAYPALNATSLNFWYGTTGNTDTYWNLTAYFHTQLPRLAEAGIYGYYYPSPLNSSAPPATQGVIQGAWIGPNLSPEQMRAIIAPMEAHIASAGWADPVYPYNATAHSGNFMAFWSQNPPESAGFSGRLGSRLLSNTSLLGDFATLRNALRTSTPAGEDMIGHLVGPAPNTLHPIGRIAGGSNAVLPAWRQTYAHVALKRQWTALNTTEKLQKTTELRDVAVRALRDLEPDSGAYMSESDPTEPFWRETKYGANYPSLLEIKQKWDPTGVFWCKQCVGSELWEAKGEFGIENGVGQNKVRLCRRGERHWSA